jgi:hypothetical protein
LFLPRCCLPRCCSPCCRKVKNSHHKMVRLNYSFSTIDEACQAISARVLNQGLSYKVLCKDKKRYTIVCKDNLCKFRIYAGISTKAKSVDTRVIITVYKEHSCSPAIHFKSKQSQSVPRQTLYYFKILTAS